MKIIKDLQYYKFSAYGFLKNLRFFDPFMLLYFRQAGINYFHIGVLFAVREIVHNLMEIPSGIAADYFGRKRSLALSFVAYIISFLIFYFWPNFYLFCLGMAFFGIGEAFRSGTHKAMILRYLKETGQDRNKTVYYGHTRGWSQTGSALSALIAGALVFFTGEYRTIFAASVIPYILNLLMLMTYPSYLNYGEESQSRDFSLQDFKKLLTTPNFLRGISNSALFDGLFKSVKDYLQPVIQSLALSLPVMTMFSGEQRTAVISSLIFSLLFLASAYSSRQAESFRKHFFSLSDAVNKALLIGAVVIVICGLAFEMNRLIITIGLFVILYMFQNTKEPLNVSYISDIIPERIMATGISVESQLNTVIIAISSILLGTAADAFGIGSAIMLAGAILLILYPLVRLK